MFQTHRNNPEFIDLYQLVIKNSHVESLPADMIERSIQKSKWYWDVQMSLLRRYLPMYQTRIFGFWISATVAIHLPEMTISAGVVGPGINQSITEWMDQSKQI